MGAAWVKELFDVPYLTFWFHPIDDQDPCTMVTGMSELVLENREPHVRIWRPEGSVTVSLLEDRVEMTDSSDDVDVYADDTYPGLYYNGRRIELAEDLDNVSHPPHYANGWSNGAEVIDLTEHLSFCSGNVVKYVCRAGRKDPDKHVEDLEKARWYLDREIARVKGH